LGEKNDDREILEQTDGKVDVFVQSISAGGSVAGIAEIDKRNPQRRRNRDSVSELEWGG
jgi:cysteine synthase